MTNESLTVDEIEPGPDGEMLATLIASSGASLVVPVSLLPAGTREGDVVTLSLQVSEEETTARRNRVKDLQKRLFG